MIDYLPDFLDGLFNMLSDSNREIRQAADSALSDFLREVRLSKVLEFGPMVSILVSQCNSKERLNRLTAISWLAELIYHPYNGGDALLPYHAEVLGAIMRCLSDAEAEIRQVADRTNGDLLTLVQETGGMFELSPLLDTLTGELLGKDDVPTKMAALRWINMLLEKRKGDMNQFIPDLLPLLLRTLSDSSDAVVLLNVQVLSRISLSHTEKERL
jgi:vacuole morphology and inheritance protein 14